MHEPEARVEEIVEFAERMEDVGSPGLSPNGQSMATAPGDVLHPILHLLICHPFLHAP